MNSTAKVFAITLITAVVLGVTKKVPWESWISGTAPITIDTSSFGASVTTSSFFEETAAQAAIENLLKNKGSLLKALDLIVYPDRILIKAQDPLKLENVDQYTLNPGGTISEPVPVRLIGGGNLAENIFTLADVKYDSISLIAKEALSRTNIEGGKVTHLEVKRNLPFDKSVHIRAYVSGTRKFAFADYDAKGKFIKATLT